MGMQQSGDGGGSALQQLIRQMVQAELGRQGTQAGGGTPGGAEASGPFPTGGTGNGGGQAQAQQSPAIEQAIRQALQGLGIGSPSPMPTQTPTPMEAQAPMPMAAQAPTPMATRPLGGAGGQGGAGGAPGSGQAGASGDSVQPGGGQTGQQAGMQRPGRQQAAAQPTPSPLDPQALAGLLVQVQMELQQEVATNLQKLKTVIHETQMIARKMEQLLEGAGSGGNQGSTGDGGGGGVGGGSRNAGGGRTSSQDGSGGRG